MTLAVRDNACPEMPNLRQPAHPRRPFALDALRAARAMMTRDLPRISWIVEYRAADLTDEERQLHLEGSKSCE